MQQSLQTHQRDDNDHPIYPEFEGKDLNILTGDSQSKPQEALQSIKRMVEDGLVHLVCGDIRSEAIKVKEPYCKDHQVDLIQACSRLKLNHSNPHPHTFQILPTWDLHITQCLDFMGSIGGNPSVPALAVITAGTEGFWGNQAPQLLSGGGGLQIEVLPANPSEFDQTIAALQAAIGQVPGRQLLFFTSNVVELIGRLVQDLADTPVLIESFLADPEDLRNALPGRFNDQIFFSGIASRAVVASELQQEFYQRIRQQFDREPTPVDTLGGTALQLTGRFANGAEAKDIDLGEDETIFASPIRFDDQGANVVGRSRFYRWNDGLSDVTP
ncbi:ABC transporter substrate-binding protein [Roseibium sp. M-1]